MKKLILTPTLLLFALALVASPIDSLISAFKNNNSQAITKMFGSSVQLTIPKKSGVFSKAQAGTIVKQFLTTNSVKSVKKIHSGSSGNTAKFCIININCTNGNTYRVNVFLKQTPKGWKIHELKFTE